MAPVSMPTVEQLGDLPELIRHVVPSAWQDMNGHVNVQHYTQLYDMAGYPLMKLIGVDEDYVRSRNVGLFDLEHHVWFLNEIHVGDVVTGRACFVARSAKRVLSVMFIVNETRRSLASALEVISTTADLRSRKTIEIPTDIGANVDTLIAQQRTCRWTPPSSGSLKI